MADVDVDESLLLALPDPCLLAVLQHCAADDQRSVLSAARAHSRLHQAAALALGSITAIVTRQHQADSVLLYLSKHGQHVDSVSITYSRREFYHPSISLCIHPGAAPQLRSWQSKQLLAGNGLQGALHPALTQLRLDGCVMRGGTGALAAALSQLPDLQHLSLEGLCSDDANIAYCKFPTDVLQQLQQLTYLELADGVLLGPEEGSLSLQPLQALTRLVHLRVVDTAGDPDGLRLTASMLSGAHLLTCLVLEDDVLLEPAVLAGKTKLQHLHVQHCRLHAAADVAAPAQLMSHLQQLQQLTYLNLRGTFWEGVCEDTPPAAAYAALTVSSRLQHLNLRQCTLPTNAWQHILPAGRQLPQLREIIIKDLNKASGGYGVAPEGSRLVSCCPGLQSLDMRNVPYSAKLLAPLQGLSRLHTLRLAGRDTVQSVVEEGLQCVCQLTGLRKLTVKPYFGTELELVLQLTQLKQLTTLKYYCCEDVILTSQDPGDEPVWRQLLLRYINHRNPGVAQQVAAALAQQAGAALAE